MLEQSSSGIRVIQRRGDMSEGVSEWNSGGAVSLPHSVTWREGTSADSTALQALQE